MKLDRDDRTLLFRTIAFALLASILFALVFASAHRVAHPVSARHSASAAAHAAEALRVRNAETRAGLDVAAAEDVATTGRAARSTDPFGHAAGEECDAWNAALAPDLFASADQNFQNLGSFESGAVASHDSVFHVGRPVGLLLARAPPL